MALASIAFCPLTVIGGVKTAPLKDYSGTAADQALYLIPAFRAFAYGLSRDLLKQVKGLFAMSAFVFVCRHIPLI